MTHEPSTQHTSAAPDDHLDDSGERTPSVDNTTAEDTAPADSAANASGAYEFRLLIAGLESGEIEVLLTYQDVHWHFTPQQAADLGSALTHAAQRATAMRDTLPHKNSQTDG